MQVFLDLTKSGGNCMKRISLERDRRLMLSVDLPVQQILETRAKEPRHKYSRTWEINDK